MSEEKAESGTIILDSNGVELGIIKKIYTQNLARLELADSTSVALDLDLIENVLTTGRLIKKKTATLQKEFNNFLFGTTEKLDELINKTIELISIHLSEKETKKAIQYFEFDLINKCKIENNLDFYEILGLIRGIELAGKTSQDFIVKSVFKAAESNPNLNVLIAPEIIVDKLNQEKAFSRIIWNLLRIVISMAIKLKDKRLFLASSEALFDIGLDYLDNELKLALSTTEILHWYERVEDCILKYIALMLYSLELEKEDLLNLWEKVKEIYSEIIRKAKINNTIKSQALKAVENFQPKDFEKIKPIELIHSGLIGFNLQVMSEKKAMNDLKLYVISLIEKEKPISIMALEKEITSFSKGIRDVSREFLDILQQIAHYLKKIEYGDSKAHEYYLKLRNEVNNKKYEDLGYILELLNKKFQK